MAFFNCEIINIAKKLKISFIYRGIMTKILVVEDETNLNQILRDYLQHYDYNPVSAFTGQQALDLLDKEKPNLILLDLNLPDMDGLQVMREIRKRKPVPIIIISARIEEVDRLKGLELGADDYISKPFSPREVVARVNAVLRRMETRASEISHLCLGTLRMNPRGHSADLAGKPLELTPAEFDLLSLLISEPDREFTRLELLEVTQGGRYEGYERTIDIHIKNIRRKLRAIEPENNLIKTIFGVGYKACE